MPASFNSLDRLLVNEVDMFDSSLNLLGHELLDTLHENDGDESKHNEGDDRCPSQSVCGSVGVVASVKSSAKDAGVDTGNGCERNWVTHCHACHEGGNGICGKTGFDGSGSYLGPKSFAQLVVDNDVYDCGSESTTDGTSRECETSCVGEVCMGCRILNENDEEGQRSCLSDTRDDVEAVLGLAHAWVDDRVADAGDKE